MYLQQPLQLLFIHFVLHILFLHRNAYATVAGKYQDVLTLEASVAELHQMFLDFALLTEQQGELLDQIEFQVKSAGDYIEQANEEVVEAIEISKKVRKKQWYVVFIYIYYFSCRNTFKIHFPFTSFISHLLFKKKYYHCNRHGYSYYYSNLVSIDIFLTYGIKWERNMRKCKRQAIYSASDIKTSKVHILKSKICKLKSNVDFSFRMRTMPICIAEVPTYLQLFSRCIDGILINSIHSLHLEVSSYDAKRIGNHAHNPYSALGLVVLPARNIRPLTTLVIRILIIQ